MNKKTISLVILFAFLVSALFSCFTNDKETGSEISGESPEVTEESEVSEVSEESSQETPPEYYYDGITLSLLVGGNERVTEFDNDSETESTLESSFSQRIEILKNVHGISFDVDCVSENDDMTTEIFSRSQSGIETSLVLYGASSFGKHIFSGLYYDLNSLDSLSDVTGNSFSSSLSLCGKLYFVTADVCATSYDSAYALFYNKELAKRINEDMIGLAVSGGFTIDTMYEYAKEASSGKLSFYSESCVFGIVSKAEDFSAFMTSCGENTVVKNDEDFPVRNIGKSENTAFYEKLRSILSDTKCAGIAESYGSWKTTHEKEVEMFVSGNSLFMPYTLSLATKGENEYGFSVGILPMPKKVAESGYNTPVDLYSLSVMGIPTSNVSLLEQTCNAISLLDYYGRNYVREAYISSVVRNLSLEEKETEILSIICDNLSFDTGALYITTGIGDTSLGRIYGYSAVSEEPFEVTVNPLLPAYERGIEEITAKINGGQVNERKTNR